MLFTIVDSRLLSSAGGKQCFSIERKIALELIPIFVGQISCLRAWSASYSLGNCTYFVSYPSSKEWSRRIDRI